MLAGKCEHDAVDDSALLAVLATRWWTLTVQALTASYQVVKSA